jgi:flagellar FliL protein
MSAAKQEAPEGQEKKSSAIGKLLLPLFALVNIGVAGGGLFLAYKATIAYHPPVLHEEAAVEALKKESSEGRIVNEKVLFTMPAFTVNLAGSPQRLIRVEMTFEMLDKDGFEEIVRNSPRARDEIVRILNAKTFDDVETIQGKLFLKDQIAVALNQSMKSGVVKDIFFNEFLVQ